MSDKNKYVFNFSTIPKKEERKEIKPEVAELISNIYELKIPVDKKSNIQTKVFLHLESGIPLILLSAFILPYKVISEASL